MSKKNRHRRVPARPGAAAGTGGAGAGAGAGAGEELVESTFTALWDAIDAGDLLRAEFGAATLLSIPVRADAPADRARDYIQGLIRTVAGRQHTPAGGACLRIMAAIGPADAKRAAGQALGTLTAEGVFAPEWATDAGRPVPRQAWRGYDVYGDADIVAVTFAYGDAEHALVLTVNRGLQPVVTTLVVVPDATAALDSLRAEQDPLSRQEEISLAEARRRIEEPLARVARDPLAYLEQDSIVFLPIARTRVRRLPLDTGESVVTFTTADRAAAVSEFLASPRAAAAGDADIARFWAEILTGYSGRVPGESPTRVGPGKLAAMLLVHVPSTFMLSAAQRAGLEPAATAWTQWAAAREGLDEAAVAHLMAELTNIAGDFDAAYDDPRHVGLRAYSRDVATSDADVNVLAGISARRAFAEPHPGGRTSPDLAAVDATTAAGRATLVSAEFAGCRSDPLSSKEFVAAVTDVVEELWRGDPPATWDEAQQLHDGGMSRHDVLHALADKR
ncbi:MAG TPA: hypothetical protein VG164_01120 [Trebonia sp.]|nr:hypothetical protein [Trebonia sp.]